MTRILALSVAFGLAGVTVAQEAAKRAVPNFAGTYKVTAGTKDGEKVDKPGGVVTATADKITLKDPEGMVFEFSYMVDPKPTPTAIDLEILAPEAFKGAKAKGIVAVEGKTVKLAYHPMGGERPKDFAAKKGTGEYSFEWTKTEAK